MIDVSDIVVLSLDVGKGELHATAVTPTREEGPTSGYQTANPTSARSSTS